MKHRNALAALALTLALAGCKAQEGDPAPTVPTVTAVHPASGLRVIAVAITHAGKLHTVKAELAQSQQEQAKGLMFRTALGPDEGMLFPFTPAKQASFWMKGTVIPLDLLFIAPDGQIANIAANAVPYDESKLRSEGAVKAVLEIPGGRAAELGLAAGDIVQW
ncbi:MAG: DUF192 domain-containing protein [Novosphingobium sp.]|uniref:DUF192 domain-containing protein n=1 Tax=Novosphingobium sp. TaxID=1874826 RepID=UPI0032BB8D86